MLCLHGPWFVFPAGEVYLLLGAQRVVSLLGPGAAHGTEKKRGKTARRAAAPLLTRPRLRPCAAVVEHDQDTLEKLIGEGGEANGLMDAESGRTLLHEAAKLGYATVISPFTPRRRDTPLSCRPRTAPWLQKVVVPQECLRPLPPACVEISDLPSVEL